MFDGTNGQAPKCRFDFKCLEDDSRHPLCNVVDAKVDGILFVDANIDVDCSHRETIGQADACACPRHYSLRSKAYHRRISSPMSAREKPPSLGQYSPGCQEPPSTVQEAVRILIHQLSLKDKATIANASTEEVGELTIGLTSAISDGFGLESGNQALMESCSKDAGCEIEHPGDAAAIILARLVMAVVKTHKISSV